MKPIYLGLIINLAAKKIIKADIGDNRDEVEANTKEQAQLQPYSIIDITDTAPEVVGSIIEFWTLYGVDNPLKLLKQLIKEDY